MNVAEWILVVILSVTLFVFLILGIILLVKLIKLTKSAKLVIEKGQDVVERAQDIADKADDVVARARHFTSIGNIAKAFAKRYNKTKSRNKER